MVNEVATPAGHICPARVASSVGTVDDSAAGDVTGAQVAASLRRWGG
jgi:hypothetical protein